MARTPANSEPAKPPKSIARWVAGVVAVCSGGATIYGLFSDKRVAILAFIGVVFALVLLLVVQRAIRAVSAENAKFYDLLVKALIVFVVLYFIALSAALFPFLVNWLTKGDPKGGGTMVSPTPTSTATAIASVPSPQSPVELPPGLSKACEAPAHGCTVFLFDYVSDQVSRAELNEFQNIQSHRFDKGLYNYLETNDLLKEIKFKVVRCSAATITEQSLADRAVKALKVPAIMWGFIKKLPDNRLVSTTKITLGDASIRQLGSREELGVDITQLLALEAPIQGNPLVMASLAVGEAHLKNGRPDFARQAFLHARGKAEHLNASDIVKALDMRLQQLNAQNPTAILQPIGGGAP